MLDLDTGRGAEHRYLSGPLMEECAATLARLSVAERAYRIVEVAGTHLAHAGLGRRNERAGSISDGYSISAGGGRR